MIAARLQTQPIERHLIAVQMSTVYTATDRPQRDSDSTSTSYSARCIAEIDHTAVTRRAPAASNRSRRKSMGRVYVGTDRIATFQLELTLSGAHRASVITRRQE